MVDRELPWSTVNDHGRPWTTMVNRQRPWSNVKYHGRPWTTISLNGTMVSDHDVPFHETCSTMVDHGSSRSTMFVHVRHVNQTAVTYRYGSKLTKWRSPTDMTLSQHTVVTYRHDTKSTYGGHLHTWHQVNQTAVTYRHGSKLTKRRSPTDNTPSQHTSVTYRHDIKST